MDANEASAEPVILAPEKSTLPDTLTHRRHGLSTRYPGTAVGEALLASSNFRLTSHRTPDCAALFEIPIESATVW